MTLWLLARTILWGIWKIPEIILSVVGTIEGMDKGGVHFFTGDNDGGFLGLIRSAIDGEDGLVFEIGYFSSGVLGDEGAAGDVPEANFEGEGSGVGAESDVSEMECGRAEVHTDALSA